VISVVIPTVEGREEHYDHCADAYARRTVQAFELITERDYPSVGLAWQAGAERATGDFIHLTCDDIEPHDDWATAAIEAVEQGFIPAPRVYGADGTPQSWPRQGQELTDWEPVYMTSLPFCSREQWQRITPLFTAHYYTDDFFSYRAALAGWEPRVRVGYDFTHYWAQHKRGAGMTEGDRMQHDGELYGTARAMVASGQWNSPWPSEGI